MTTTQELLPADRYLPDATYHQLIDRLMAPIASLDPRTVVIELLGEVAGVWPQSARGAGD